MEKDRGHTPSVEIVFLLIPAFPTAIQFLSLARSIDSVPCSLGVLQKFIGIFNQLLSVLTMPGWIW